MKKLILDLTEDQEKELCQDILQRTFIILYKRVSPVTEVKHENCINKIVENSMTVSIL